LQLDSASSIGERPKSAHFNIAVLLFILFAALPSAASARAGVSSIVIDAETGRTLAARHPDRRHHPASLAKMMTLYLAFEAVSRGDATLGQRLPVSRRAASREPTKLGLRAGERVSLKNLILGLVTQSANDAAVVIAEGLAGAENRFAERMTRKARELGMTRTVFRNASGLPDRRAWTTARDMSLLARGLLVDFKSYYRYFATERFDFRGRTYRNHNHLLGRYEGLDGIKTGYTRASGFHLAASAKRGDRRVIAVVLGGRTWPSRDREMVALLDSAFDTPVNPSPREPVLHALADGVERAAAKLSPISTVEAATAATKPADDDAGDWSVQVGAFSRRAQAEQRAQRIMALDDRLNADNKRIVTSRKRGRTLYRVRFGDLTKASADAVCQALRSAGRDCNAGPELR
jgi:D-alanyl-D-alanine carboxypeptidase